MHKSKDKDSFIKKPVYPGGKKALDAFVKSNLKYPKEALKNKIEGKVFVELDVDYNGKVTNVKVLNGIGHGCNEEAARVVGLLQFTSPKNKGMRVGGRRRLNIHFRLPKAKEVKPTMKYSITTTSKAIPPKKEVAKKKSTYTYTIKW